MRLASVARSSSSAAKRFFFASAKLTWRSSSSFLCLLCASSCGERLVCIDVEVVEGVVVVDDVVVVEDVRVGGVAVVTSIGDGAEVALDVGTFVFVCAGIGTNVAR